MHTYNIYIHKPEGKRSLQRPKNRRMDSAVGCGSVDLSQVD
jgi:hypothetical protein